MSTARLHTNLQTKDILLDLFDPWQNSEKYQVYITEKEYLFFTSNL